MPSANQDLNQPLLMAPAFFPKPWGSESWEVSDRPEGASRVDGGPHDGKTLGELMPFRQPLLFKFLTCKETLSVQVHPDDAAAAPHGDLGKEESWVILEAEPGACLYLGFDRSTSAEEVRQATLAGELEELLRKVPVEAGQMYHVPPGTVHAIGGGLQLAEIQQSSNITYRLYDWGRVGLDGAPRELHIEESLAVANFEPSDHLCEGDTLECPYYELVRTRVNGSRGVSPPSPWIIACLSGEARVEANNARVRLPARRTVVISENVGKLILDGDAELLCATPVR